MDYFATIDAGIVTCNNLQEESIPLNSGLNQVFF